MNVDDICRATAGRIIQHRLGRSSIKTIETYTHIVPYKRPASRLDDMGL